MRFVVEWVRDYRNIVEYSFDTSNSTKRQKELLEKAITKSESHLQKLMTECSCTTFDTLPAFKLAILSISLLDKELYDMRAETRNQIKWVISNYLSKKLEVDDIKIYKASDLKEILQSYATILRLDENEDLKDKAYAVLMEFLIKDFCLGLNREDSYDATIEKLCAMCYDRVI